MNRTREALQFTGIALAYACPVQPETFDEVLRRRILVEFRATQ
jgi:hypothetical protein